MNQQTASIAPTSASTASRVPQLAFEHIDLEGIRHFVDESPEVLAGLIKLALTSGRDQIAAVNRTYTEATAPQQRLAIHNLLNTFNFLHAKSAMVTARRAERHVAASFQPLGRLLLAELNDAFRAVESDLETLLLADLPEFRVN